MYHICFLFQGENSNDTRGDDEIINIEPADSSKADDSLLLCYKSGLAIFGIVRLVNGRVLEKVFWGLFTSAILIFTCYEMYENAARYLAFEVRTEVRIEKKMERKLPVVTFCLESTFNAKFECYNGKSLWGHDKDCRKGKQKDAYMEYKKGHGDTHVWVRGKHIGNDCYIFIATYS